MINWDKLSKKESLIIRKIAHKADSITKQDLDLLKTEMDIKACHICDVKLDLEGMLNADAFNLIHDVFGISNHINRNTGKLKNGFLPRFAMKDKATYTD